MAVVELIICLVTFKDATGARYREANPMVHSAGGSRTVESLKNPITWICAVFLLCYVGAEVAVSDEYNFYSFNMKIC